VGGIELASITLINKQFTISKLKLYTQIYIQMKLVGNANIRLFNNFLTII